MATYYVRKDRPLDGSDGPPDASGLFYWFDGSDAAVVDPNAVWTDETNTDDSSVATVGYTTTSGTESTAQIKIEGTDAPASGGTISSVFLWIYIGSGNVSTTCTVKVYTDGEGENLGQFGFTETPGEWYSIGSITTPTGGWTWAKVQALEAKAWQTSGTDRLEIAAIGVVVHTTTEGESAADPYRTIDEAANAVAAGDTVFVGSGTYREVVTMDTSGSSGSEIKFYADVTGAQTGDAGLVVISAFDDSNTASRASCWDPDGRTFIEVYDFVMQGGTSGVVYDNNTAAQNFEGVVFEGCSFVAGPDDGDYAVYIDFNGALTPTAAGLTVNDCAFHGGVRLLVLDNETAETDLKAAFNNCQFTGGGSTTLGLTGIQFNVQSSGTYSAGGLDVYNCTFFGTYYGAYCDNGASTTYPMTVNNCLFYGGGPGFIREPQMTERLSPITTRLWVCCPCTRT